ncbi:LacI family DNA-binding transcriptional regulator [Paenibacillus daejeonensis]|uniref:LacI family DNA-binding transcriptional regulator n=1 Tax=Paenibacillus daejeonensis TaxID=135193 RepID=UPI00036249FD|nr:LacI family DNA-binding transcriptional regulator [Paenibacillus daejeonensis]
MKKPVTIHDIAKLANASSATVSRVLSNSNYPVSAAMREKITRIAKEANYIPNMLGKQLKTNTSMTIGVIIPSISNPFYSSVILGVEEIAREHNYHVIVCNSLQNPDFELGYLQTMAEKQVKGIILSSIAQNTSLLKGLLQNGMHAIAIDQRIDEEEISQIEFNYAKGGYMATKHLIEHGHTRIGYATSELDRHSRTEIHQGYLKAMSEAGLKPVVEISGAGKVFSSSNEFDSGKQLADKMLERHKDLTAIFACNDVMAFGVIHTLTSRGLRVPDDLSVIGFDGIEYGQMIHPPLTTIKQPDYEMGILACKLLLDKLQDKDSSHLSVMLQPRLVERASVTTRQAGD